MNRLTLSAVICLIVAATTVLAYVPKPNGLDTVVEWKLLEYEFPTENDRKTAESNGNLVPANAIPIDVAPFYTGREKMRLFTTIPRFTTGIPFTLAIVTESGKDVPKLKPYPNYDWHSSHGANCDSITSAFRVAINECDQMWVIDSGVISGVQLCAPQLLLFDLKTDKLLHRYRFPSSIFTPTASLFITPAVNVRDPPPEGRCQRTMVYVADVNNHGLVIYDQEKNTAWRAEHKFMYPDPNVGTHTIAGDSFELLDGIFALATSKRNLYFHPLASKKEYGVPLSVLDNSANWANGVSANASSFKQLGSRGSECAADAMDSRDNLYCVTFNPIRLISYNTKSAYNQKNFREICVDQERLQFVSGMKVIRNPAGNEELWMMSNRFQKFAAGTQNIDEVNFRILKINIDEGHLNGLDVGRAHESSNDLRNRLVFGS